MSNLLVKGTEKKTKMLITRFLASFNFSSKPYTRLELQIQSRLDVVKLKDTISIIS